MQASADKQLLGKRTKREKALLASDDPVSEITRNLDTKRRKRFHV